MQKDGLNEIYEIKKQIGAGGGGEVFLAYHKRLEKQVVLKRIKENVKDTLDVRAEVDILKNLKHTYLPQVLDFLTIENDIYTVMDFITGDTFKDELKRRGKFPQTKVVKWAEQLGEALVYLHKQNPPVIHSDIKPANVMLTEDDDVCLFDFNISQLFEKNQKTLLLGRTNGYAPPEQYQVSEVTVASPAPGGFSLRELCAQPAAQPDDDVTDIASGAALDDDVTDLAGGAALDDATRISTQFLPRPDAVQATVSQTETMVQCRLDERSDIYALGATLYHIVSGVKPAKSIDVVTPIQELCPNLSDGLLYIITKCMQPDPKDRFQSAQEYLNAVKNIYRLDGEYKAYRRKTRTIKAVLLGAFVLFSGAAILGANMIKVEKTNEYYAYYNAAISSIEQYDFTSAQQYNETMLAMQPSSIYSYYLEALMLYEQNMQSEALSYLSLNETAQIEALAADNMEVSASIEHLKADCYFDLGDYATAAEYYSRSLKLDASNAEVYTAYVIALARMGEADQAEQVLQNASSISTEYMQLAQAEIWVAQALYEQAEVQLLTLISTSSDESMVMHAYTALSDCYSSIGTLEALEKNSEVLLHAQANLSYVNSILFYQLAGENYAKLSQLDEENKIAYCLLAAQEYQKFIELGFASITIYYNISVLYQDALELEKALETTVTMIENYPQDYRGYLQQCFILAEIEGFKENSARDYSEVFAVYQQATQLYAQQKTEDLQMQMLESVISDLEKGGWL